MQIYKEFSSRGFNLVPLYSLIVAEEELMNVAVPTSNWRRNGREETWTETMEGGGRGLVGGRSGGRLPDMAGCGGGRVTGLDDITSCPAAFH